MFVLLIACTIIWSKYMSAVRYLFPNSALCENRHYIPASLIFKFLSSCPLLFYMSLNDARGNNGLRRGRQCLCTLQHACPYAKKINNSGVKICTFPTKRLPLHSQKRKGWFGSSVGLEQQPSKLWVKGSNPFRITLRTS